VACGYKYFLIYVTYLKIKMANVASGLNVNLRKFDIRSMQKDGICIFIGRRRTGKSTLVKDILFHHQDMPMATVISGTEESNGFYKTMIPPLLIHNEFNPLILDNFVKRQRRLMATISRQKEQGIQSRIDPKTLLILDDCMYDESWCSDRNIRYLFMNGRHIKTFFMITMQYPLGVPPVLRTNVDYTFILREPYLSNRRKIFDNYGSAFPSFEFFCQVMDQCTQNYECLVIDNTKISNKLEDCILWYKAEVRQDFRLCSPEVWAQSAQLYREKNNDDDDNYFDPNASRKLKGPAITIRKSQ
jgi:hypothetical protein